MAAGIGATLFANVAAGLSWGPLGAVVAAWPALALVGSYELLMALVRGQAAAQPGGTHPAGPGAQVAHDAEQAAQSALRATVAAGNPLSGRQLAERFGLNRAQVAQVRQAVLAGANGHGAGGDQ